MFKKTLTSRSTLVLVRKESALVTKQVGNCPLERERTLVPLVLDAGLTNFPLPYIHRHLVRQISSNHYRRQGRLYTLKGKYL